MIELVQGDITLETVDAIVNAANSSLLGAAEWMALSIELPRARRSRCLSRRSSGQRSGAWTHFRR